MGRIGKDFKVWIGDDNLGFKCLFCIRCCVKNFMCIMVLVFYYSLLFID